MRYSAYKKSIWFCLAAVLVSVWSCKTATEQNENIIDLAGEWKFAIDSLDRGLNENWSLKNMRETVNLPGSMAENGKGEDPNLSTDWTGTIVDSSYFYEDRYAKYRNPDNFKIPFWLKPVKYYKGPAWYQKNVQIPQTWNGKRITLTLERCHWETTVFVDGQKIGTQNSLSVPHIYDLTGQMKPGNHKLTIRVDNRIIIPVGINSHSITDHTQTSWNGIIGDIFLEAGNPVYIEDVQVYPDIIQRSAKLRIRIMNPGNKSFDGTFSINAESFNTEDARVIPGVEKNIEITGEMQEFNIDYNFGEQLQLWDEFSPVLYHLNVNLSDNAGQEVDYKVVDFGMREFKANGTRFVVNGHPVFLRGTVECCIFPLTGYPAMDEESWEYIFSTCHDYGLNHMRFHSWCPPEAAFRAADELGFYLQIECGSWANWPNSSIGDGLPVDRFIYEESDRILKTYGNHPSFCMLAYGNEPAGDSLEAYLGKLVNYWKAKDRRRVYTGGAGWPFIPENDYHNGAEPRIQHWGEGLASIINSKPPQTVFDYRDFLSKYDKPWVSHEIGQWCAYPNFDEMQKYTGVLKPTNFEIFQETLEENHMGEQAEDFLMASGKLQVLCYKADIEAALRTPGFAGFQLLQLHDFPGQGTALVGVLDAFFESKGYVAPYDFRRFCSETVPLARLGKMTYRNNENFLAKIEIAHFGDSVLVNPAVVWEIINSDGEVIKNGRFLPGRIPVGNNIALGEIKMPLRNIKKAEELSLWISIEGTAIVNYWDFWVYPVKQESITGRVVIAHSLNEDVMKQLNNGRSVLLLASGKVKEDKGANIAVGFSSIFWNTAWTAGQAPHTLGILCNPEHPVFQEFPTEFHSNWQWWDPMSHCQAMIIDSLPPDLTPLIQPIDTWFENRRLALLFEAMVGEGKLMVCSIDLESDLSKRPVANQLRYSILKYMNSGSFDPDVELDAGQIQSLFAF
jgi:hypothetical protein